MRAVTSLLLLTASACVPPEPAGEPYGVYAVVGTIRAHECGQEAAPVATPYERVFELRRTESGIGYLYGSDGSVMEGTFAADGSFRFAEQTWTRVIEPEEVLEIRGCDLVVTMILEGTAKRTEDETTGETELEPLEGTLVTRISPSSGSDCSELLFGSSSGGNFHALPCAITLALVGEPQVDESEAASDAQ
jgi:hypothetical protein